LSRAVAPIFALLSCASPAPAPVGPPPGPEVLTWVEGAPARGVATLVVQVRAPADADLALPEPEIPRLTVTPVDSAIQERVGAQVVTTRRYRLTGEPGSYEIPSLSAGDAASAPIWLDLGAPASTLDGFADIVDPAPTYSISTAMVVGSVCVGLTAVGAVGGVALAFSAALRGRRPRELPPEPPDVLALRRWDAVRADPTLDDQAVAVAIATIFREYAEAVLGFPATAWTTREILDHLGSLAHLPDGNVGRAKRILRATDYIKFADAAARDALFDELDDALRTFVGSTRPRRYGEGST
jgi:hypothetical protein